MKPEYIIVHHTAVSREKNAHQLNATNNSHRDRGFPRSSTGFWIGYHYLIEPNGALYHPREDSEVGAHCKEESMNYKSLGVSLTGDFDNEMPTDKQLSTLATLLTALRIKYHISRSHVKFHRDYASYKSCPGTNFTRELLEKNMPMKELVRDKDTGQHFFVKNGTEGKQEINTVAGLLTVLGREFGVRNLDKSSLQKIPDKRYF
jgi:hypothetical protein